MRVMVLYVILLKKSYKMYQIMNYVKKHTHMFKCPLQYTYIVDLQCLDPVSGNFK